MCSEKLQFSLQAVWRRGGCMYLGVCALNLPVLFHLLKLLLCPVGGLGSDFFPWYSAQGGNLSLKSNETIQLL